MNPIAAFGRLFAWLPKDHPFFHLDDNFRGDRASLESHELFTILALFGIAIAAYAVLAFFARTRSNRPCNSPRRLFQSLCRAHDLSHRERKRLKRLAAGQGLRDPSRLFLEPLRFDLAGEPDRFDETAALRARLFGGPSAEEPAESTE